MDALEVLPGWLRGLSTRRPAAAQPAAADVPVLVPDVTRDVAAIAREIRPLLAAGDAADSSEPPAYSSAVVPPVPSWAPGAPFGMARYDR